MAMMNRLISWWKSLPLSWSAWRIVASVSAGDEIPHCLPRKGVIVVGSPECATWLAFECPCRTGHRLMVNLDKHRYPFWSIDSLRPLSVWPSIDSMSSSGRCHFVVRNGRIRWIANDGSDSA